MKIIEKDISNIGMLTINRDIEFGELHYNDSDDDLYEDKVLEIIRNDISLQANVYKHYFQHKHGETLDSLGTQIHNYYQISDDKEIDCYIEKYLKIYKRVMVLNSCNKFLGFGLFGLRNSAYYAMEGLINQGNDNRIISWLFYGKIGHKPQSYGNDYKLLKCEAEDREIKIIDEFLKDPFIQYVKTYIKETGSYYAIAMPYWNIFEIEQSEIMINLAMVFDVFILGCCTPFLSESIFIGDKTN